MAVLSISPLLSSRPRRRPLSVASLAAARDRRRPALVWFKNDLRIVDHPGLAAAVSDHRPVVPFYVFDPRLLSDLSVEMLELLLYAVEDLKIALKGQGADLLVGVGSAEDIILHLVNEVKPSHIFSEEEVEYKLRELTVAVESSLSVLPMSWQNPEFVFWRTPFYDTNNLKELPASYHDFMKLRPTITAPIAETTMHPYNFDLRSDNLPTLDDLKKCLTENSKHLDEGWTSLRNMSATQILRKNKPVPSRNYKTNSQEFPFAIDDDKKLRVAKTYFASRNGSQVRGGTEVVLDALAAYLRYLEGTARDDWQELHDKLRMTESGRGNSFSSLFGAALYFGTISRRQAYTEAIKYERERNAGFLSPFGGYSAPTVTVAVDTICSMEWYWLLALKSQLCQEGMYSSRIWRWKGYLIQYTTAGYEGPAILLVHGFGAFLEHFRENISKIANSGNRVWAITLLGFGKSEKPNVIYTELKWAELLRDFVIEVVREPVHIVGNSIGGYIVSLVAGLWPAVVKSLVLLNTAGSVITNYSSSLLLPEEEQTSGFTRLIARLLLMYLRTRAAEILKMYYPTNRERVDSWLINNILRASYDPGVHAVLESVVNLKLSIPLNFLFNSFDGEVLVIQGMKDPLIKSESFLEKLRKHCSNITIRKLDAACTIMFLIAYLVDYLFMAIASGHCPHDELPNEVNVIITEWIKNFAEITPRV